VIFLEFKDLYKFKKRLTAADDILKQDNALSDNTVSTVLFSNPQLGTSFKINKNNTLVITLDEHNNNRYRQYYPQMPRSLCVLYTPPTEECFGGSIAGLKYIVDGATNFDGNLILIAGELLVVSDANISHVRTSYDAMLRFKIKHVFDLYDNDDPNKQAVIREQRVLSYLFFYVINSFKGYGNGDLAIDRNLDILQIKDLAAIMLSDEGGVCRHSSLLLAKFIQFAINDQLLSGYCKYRSTVPQGKTIGHSWLEYHNPQLLGENGYYLLDPINKVFFTRNQLAQEKPEINEIYRIFENNLSANPVNYSNYAQEMARLNPKRSWFGVRF